MLELINVFLNGFGMILMAAISIILFMLAYELFTWRLRKAKFGRRLEEFNGRLAILELFQALDGRKPLSKKDNFKKTGAAKVSKAPRASKKPFRAVVKVNQVTER